MISELFKRKSIKELKSTGWKRSAAVNEVIVVKVFRTPLLCNIYNSQNSISVSLKENIHDIHDIHKGAGKAFIVNGLGEL